MCVAVAAAGAETWSSGIMTLFRRRIAREREVGGAREKARVYTYGEGKYRSSRSGFVGHMF